MRRNLFIVYSLPCNSNNVAAYGSWIKGEEAQYNIFGNSVESAISFAEKAIYGIDHPLAGQPTKNMELGGEQQ